MNTNNERDFLDELRELNKDNINEDKERRNAFFDKLMVIDSDASFYLEHLSSVYASEFEKQYEENIAKDYILLELFCGEIANQIQDNLIKDEVSHLYIDKRSSAYALTYVGSIKGMKSLIDKSSSHFDFMKKSILSGLITRYSSELQNKNTRNIERLNKLVAIYIEHTMNIEIGNNRVIDVEFINEIINSKNDNESYTSMSYISTIAIYNLIDRKYNNRSNYSDYYGYGFKKYNK